MTTCKGFAASIASFAMLALSLASGSASAGPSASADDTAKFLAGLPTSAGSPLTAYEAENFWKQHQRGFDGAYDGLEKRQFSKIRIWASKNLPEQKPVAFYMFSGPDFLYANEFLPAADTYIMAGLEPPGKLPELTKLSRGQIAGALGELRSSLSSVLNYSFFRTHDMRLELSSGQMMGTVPILLTFMSRAGKTIYDVEIFDLAKDGTIHPIEEKIANASSKGAKITFSDNTGKKRTLYYFSTDVSENGIKTSGFLTFLGKFGTGNSFVKSASYLMHSDNFATIRQFLLDHSDTLLQDDSGVPIRFMAKGWKLHPFGRYVGPIPLFAGSTQQKLYEIFGKDKTTPIDFGIGYQYKPMESNLLLAVKDPNATAFEVAPPPAKPKVAEGATPKPRVEARADSPRREARYYRKRKEQTVANPYPKMFGYSQ
jgi:hypothetical protein